MNNIETLNKDKNNKVSKIIASTYDPRHYQKMGHHQRNVIVNSNSVLMDQSQPPPPLIEQNICFCSKFLNPFSTSFGYEHSHINPQTFRYFFIGILEW